MSTRSSRAVETRLPYAGASVSRPLPIRPALRPAVVLAVMLPLAGANAYAATCDNQVLPGGSACATTVSAGSAVNNTTIDNGATQKVSGSANASIVNSGGSQAVSRGGIATNTIVNLDGRQSVLSGGSAVDTVISGGTQYVSSGGVAVNTVVSSGGSFGVSKGGLAVGAVVSSGGLQRVYSGGVVSGNIIAGGKQYVSAGGSAVATTVNAGSQVVYARGSASATVVNSSAVQTVSSGGVASATTINSGGTQSVLPGGAAAQSIVGAGGAMVVDVGGTAAAGPVAAATLEGVTVAGTLTIAEAASDRLTGGAAASIDGLVLSGGTVAVGAPGAGGYKTLTVYGLSGSGQFVLNTNIGAAQADQLVVNQGSGVFTLTVHDSSTTVPTSPSERLMLVNATSSTATFALAGNAMDLGAYKFALQDVGGQYYLYNTGGKSDIATVAQAAAAVPALLWNQQLEQTFTQLASYRGGTADGQFWVRSFDEHLRASPDGTSTMMDYYGVQIGRDWRISTANGNWHVGATGGFAQANEDFSDVGNGTARPWNLGVYAGYNDLNGVFGDAIVRYIGMKQSANVTTAANPATAGYDLSGYSMSLDGGKRIPLAGRWWAEPRVELTYQHSGSVDYQTTFGTLVGLGGSSLTLGSAGVSFGATWMAGDIKLDPFINLAATHVFNGNVTDSIGGTTLTTSVPQSWVAASAGMSVLLTRRTRAYGSFSLGKGHDYTQPWAVTLGLSYAVD